jgi:methylphosphotriester-DNA--protein-cysteine methyltransferase
MSKVIRLLVCLMVISMFSAISLVPTSALAKQQNEQTNKKEEVVYATKNGEKYHKESCPFIKNRETTAISENDAVSKGLKPCGRCFKEDNE